MVSAPNFAELERWARENGLGFHSREDLIGQEKVRVLFDGIVAEVNRDLAQFEKLKKVLLVADEFSVADGSLTPTLKLKRRVVEERYRQHIRKLYENDPKPADPADVAAGKS